MRRLEIINEYRTRGVLIETLLMGIDSLKVYALYGVNVAPSGVPPARGPQRAVSLLTNSERAAYEAIASDPTFRHVSSRNASHVALLSQSSRHGYVWDPSTSAIDGVNLVEL
jgi:hypothetical protein